MAAYKVAGRPLVHNGRRLRVGWKLELGPEDGHILCQLGRVTPYEKPARKRRAKATASEEG
jgi:hypothetical protein